MTKSIAILACPRCNAAFGHRVREASPLIDHIARWSDGKCAEAMWPDPLRITSCPGCAEFLWLEDANRLGALPFYRPSAPEADVWITAAGPSHETVIAQLAKDIQRRGQEAEIERELASKPLRLTSGASIEGAESIARHYEQLGATIRVHHLPFDPRWEDWARVPIARTLTAAEINAALAGGHGSTPARERYLRVRVWWAHNDRYRSGGVPWQLPDGERRDGLTRLAELLSDEVPGELLMKAELARQMGDFERARKLLASPLLDPCRDQAAELNRLAEAGHSALVRLNPDD